MDHAIIAETGEFLVSDTWEVMWWVPPRQPEGGWTPLPGGDGIEIAGAEGGGLWLRRRVKEPVQGEATPDGRKAPGTAQDLPDGFTIVDTPWGLMWNNGGAKPV